MPSLVSLALIVTEI